MDEKISLEAIEQYSDTYADRILKGFFSSKERITGSEILSLCNIQQVNLFVVSELFKNWREENKKLRSQYFNYDHPEVKEAMESLMTLLSKKHKHRSRALYAPFEKGSISNIVGRF